MPRKPQKDPSSRRKPHPARAPEAAFQELLASLDAETLARLRDVLDGDDAWANADEDPLTLFDEFLSRVEAIPTQPAAADDNDDFFADFVAMLSQLAIDDHGGDPDARQLRAQIYDRLEGAIVTGRLDAAALMLVAKILSDAGWSVPERLKSRLVELLETTGLSVIEAGAADLKTALAEIADAAEGDAFAAYDAVNSVLAAFPAEIAARMATTLGEGRAPLLLHVLAGFVMHREPALALAAIEALKRAVRPERVESALVERLVRMRPWLPSDRQGPLDDTIRSLRGAALPPIETERPNTAKCFVLACDGAGAGGVLATMKAADGWRFVSAMTNPSGVADVISLEGLAKREADATVRSMREAVTAAQTDVEGVADYLALALGDNLAAKLPPPFKLIALVESLGLGPIAPRTLSGADLIAELLADCPASQRDKAAIAAAHAKVMDGACEQPWYEAGECVEQLLAPLRGSKARVKALLTDYLPRRREFWTRICARTAFALRLEPKLYGGYSRDLALVGREIASGAPLAQIPLMRRIADMTVSAFESRP